MNIIDSPKNIIIHYLLLLAQYTIIYNNYFTTISFVALLAFVVRLGIYLIFLVLVKNNVTSIYRQKNKEKEEKLVQCDEAKTTLG